MLLVFAKVSPSMRSLELAETALSMRTASFKADDFWTTFEVIENGELGMQDFLVPSSQLPVTPFHPHSFLLLRKSRVIIFTNSISVQKALFRFCRAQNELAEGFQGLAH